MKIKLKLTFQVCFIKKHPFLKKNIIVKAMNPHHKESDEICNIQLLEILNLNPCDEEQKPYIYHDKTGGSWNTGLEKKKIAYF